MPSDSSNSIQLLQNAMKNNLYKKLVLQLKKDFSLANVDIDLSLGIEANDLRATLHEKVYYLIMEKFSDYLNLLYIVDVPERSFKEIRVTDVVEVAEQVCFLILKRELQKVFLKEKYSS